VTKCNIDRKNQLCKIQVISQSRRGTVTGKKHNLEVCFWTREKNAADVAEKKTRKGNKPQFHCERGGTGNIRRTTKTKGRDVSRVQNALKKRTDQEGTCWFLQRYDMTHLRGKDQLRRKERGTLLKMKTRGSEQQKGGRLVPRRRPGGNNFRSSKLKERNSGGNSRLDGDAPGGAQPGMEPDKQDKKHAEPSRNRLTAIHQ